MILSHVNLCVLQSADFKIKSTEFDSPDRHDLDGDGCLNRAEEPVLSRWNLVFFWKVSIWNLISTSSELFQVEAFGKGEFEIQLLRAQIDMSKVGTILNRSTKLSTQSLFCVVAVSVVAALCQR